jgi:hypothetical protein
MVLDEEIVVIIVEEEEVTDTKVTVLTSEDP